MSFYDFNKANQTEKLKIEQNRIDQQNLRQNMQEGSYEPANRNRARKNSFQMLANQQESARLLPEPEKNNERDVGERKKGDKVDGNYKKYQKHVKQPGETPQQRLKSKLNFILSTFQEEQSVGSVTYYNQSDRSQQSASELSSSIHSNLRFPLGGSKNVPEYEVNGKNSFKKDEQQNQFLQYGKAPEKQPKVIQKYLFFPSKIQVRPQLQSVSQKNQILNQKDREVHLIKEKNENKQPKESNRFKTKEELNNQLAQSEFQNLGKSVDMNKLKEHFNTPEIKKDIQSQFLIQFEEPSEQIQQNTKRKQPFQKHSFEEIQLMLGQPANKREKDARIDQNNSIHSKFKEKGTEKSIQKASITKKEANRSISSQNSQRIEMYEPNLKPQPKVSFKSDRYKQISNLSQQLSNKQQSDSIKLKKSDFQSAKLKSNDLTNREKESLGNETTKRKEYANDALEQLISESNSPRDRSSRIEISPAKKYNHSYLKTIEFSRSSDPQLLEQVIPKNIVSFKIDNRRKLKSELSQRPDDHKKYLAILKRREEALAKKVREQLRVGSRLVYQESSSRLSKQSSLVENERNEAESQAALGNPLIAKTKKFFDPQNEESTIKKREHLENQIPYFPTENLKYPKNYNPQQVPGTIYSQFQTILSKRQLPTLNYPTFKRKVRTKTEHDSSSSQKGRSLQSQFRQHQQALLMPSNKISYYNLNKIQKEQKKQIFSKNVSAREKYERLKQLIERI